MSALRDLAALLLAAEQVAHGASGILVLKPISGGAEAGEIWLSGGKFVHAAAPKMGDAPAWRETEPASFNGLVTALVSLARTLARGELELEPFVATTSTSGVSARPATSTAVLASAVEGHAELAAEIPPLPAAFSEVGAPRVPSLCFLQLDDRELPAVPIRAWGDLEPDLETALSLYRAGRRLAQALMPGAAREPFATTARLNDQGWLASWRAPFLSLFRLHSNGDYGLLLSFLRRDRHQGRGDAA